MKIFYLTFFGFLLQSFSATAQLDGLWVVEQVMVGKDQMTPAAKWFEFKKDSIVYGGNGGIRNTSGTYQIHESGNELLIRDENGKADEYGPFSISFEGDVMIWKREEYKQPVVVHLKRADTLPLGPWDLIVGNWIVDKKIVDGNITYESSPDAEQTYFIRWDRVFQATIKNGSSNERESGIWQIHAHMPQLTFISGKGDAFDSVWDLSFENPHQMVWKKRENKVRVTWHLHKIP